MPLRRYTEILNVLICIVLKNRPLHFASVTVRCAAPLGLLHSASSFVPLWSSILH